MKKSFIYLLFCAAVFAPCESFSQSDYSSPSQVEQRLQRLVRKYPKLASISSLTKTPASNDLFLVTLGSGDLANHPATAIVAGINPRHMVGTESAIRLIESILERDDAAQYLSEQTFYVIPSLNPDAAEGYFGALKQETNRTKSLYDNDRDGEMSEDGAEDLDGNSMITSMIVESEGGEWIKHPENDKVIIKADPSKGETGKYLLFTEGVDNDKDGLINEDGADGVDLDRNFTYKYANWGCESGNYAISEVENRALLDFLYDAFNVHTVISFGENDNLYSPTAYINRGRKGVAIDEKTASTKSKRGIKYNLNEMIAADNLFAAKASNIYKANDPSANDIMATEPLDGNFTEWAYYHYGRNSFETNVWSVDKEDGRNSRQAAFLAWAEENGIEDIGAIEWKEIEHKDFKGKKVKIGSLKPYAMYTPDLEVIEPQIEATIKSVMEIADLHPELSLTVNSEELSKGVWRVSAKIVNIGGMSTATAIGVQSYFTKFVRIELKLKDQSVLQGLRLSTLPYLDAGAAAEFSWIVEGKGKFEIEAGSPQSGYVTQVVTL